MPYCGLSSNANKTRILLVDDHPMFRQSLSISISQEPDLCIVAEASNGEEAIHLAEELVPDVIIMDISMPLINGIGATKQIKSKYPSIAVLCLTVHSDNEHVFSMLEAGAAGYLTKSSFSEEIIRAIRSIVTGDIILSPTVFQQIFDIAHFRNNIPPNRFNTLTEREIQVIRLVAKGFSNKQIAEKLKLSISTIKSYLVTIFSKLEVSSRTEVIVLGIRSGCIKLRDLGD